jgi:hypothetical protein
MAFRTDGTTEYASGVGGYPFAWMYGGDASGNRIMLLSAAGDLWTNTNGWLSTALSGKLSTTGKAADSNLLDGIDSGSFLRSDATDTASGTLTFSGTVYHTSSNTQFADYLYHYGDTNTYMRFPAADDWQVVVGGRQALRMDEGTDPDILQLVSGASGGVTVSQTGRMAQYGTIPVLEQAQTISANYTVTNNTNAMSIGPVTIANGVTVTVGDGESWVVI